MHYLRDRLRSFENIAAHGGAIGWNLRAETRVEHVTGMTISRGYFDVIGVRPAVGRGFNVDEDRPGAIEVVSTLIPSIHAARTNPAHVIRTE